MKRILLLLCILLIGVLLSGAYGIVHDQLTYSISPEYYTKFKFAQFGLYWIGENYTTQNTTEIIPRNPRLAVSLVGFLATWWVGLMIALILGILGIKIKDSKYWMQLTIKAFIITLFIAFITGLVGLAIGKLFLRAEKVNWNLPNHLIDPQAFIAVGSMHNFSYLGGFIGLIIAAIYIKRQKKILQKLAES